MFADMLSYILHREIENVDGLKVLFDNVPTALSAEGMVARLNSLKISLEDANPYVFFQQLFNSFKSFAGAYHYVDASWLFFPANRYQTGLRVWGLLTGGGIEVYRGPHYNVGLICLPKTQV